MLVGVAAGDSGADAIWMADKVAGLRIFDDPDGRMNLDLRAAGGEILAVSQFTLLGDARRGRRPSFVNAAEPALAEQLFEAFVAALRSAGHVVATGVFRADMQVALVNDGPVTILLDSRREF